MLRQLKFASLRLWCHLWGCRTNEHGWYCVRCGADLYDCFISEGRLYRLQLAWWAGKSNIVYFFRAVFGPVPSCDVCGKEMRRWRDRKEQCCSEACYQDHVPF